MKHADKRKNKAISVLVWSRLPESTFKAGFCNGILFWKSWLNALALQNLLGNLLGHWGFSLSSRAWKGCYDRVAHIISAQGFRAWPECFKSDVLTAQNSRLYHLILPLHSFVTALLGLWPLVCLMSFVNSTCPRSFVCCGCSARLMLSLWLRMGGVQLLDFRHRDIEDPLLAGDNKLYIHV